MNEKPPSTSGSGTPGLIARVLRAFKGEPWSRDEIQTFIESDAELDAEEKSMLSGVLEVSETQVREVMVPRSQMVVIDIEGYRARREEQLGRLAQKMAAQAADLDRTMELEPMPPNERRIIHVALRDNPAVTTESIGEGSSRKVTIIPKA